MRRLYRMRSKDFLGRCTSLTQKLALHHTACRDHKEIDLNRGGQARLVGIARADQVFSRPAGSQAGQDQVMKIEPARVR